MHDNEFAEVELSRYAQADNCGMQLVRNPKQFDVIVTDNLFGDMPSDVASMLTDRSACRRRHRLARRTSRAAPGAV